RLELPKSLASSAVSSGLVLGAIGGKHPGKLPGWSLHHSRHLGGRRVDQADKLAAQFVERRQGSQCLDPFRVQDLTFKTATNDGQLLVLLGELDADLGRSHRIIRYRHGGRSGEQRRQRLKRRALESKLHEAVFGNAVAGT